VTRDGPKPTCIYCGVREGTTKDHVPPKNLFSIPRPNLVTVPCCYPCRQGQSLDDEYFVRMIAMRRDVADNPSAAFAIDAVHRSFTKPHKIGFTRALLESINEFPVYTPAGLYLGHATSYDVDLQRLCKVIERTTRGLYFHEFKARLPHDHRCVTYALDGFASAGSKVNATIGPVLDHALSGKKRTFGNNAFSYWVQRLDGPNSTTLWVFHVYGCVGFMAFTMPSNESGVAAKCSLSRN
jgi:hypothetical protein